MIKIAFFDIDGTILKFGHHELTDRMRETLLKLKENGVLICMATGRSNPCLPTFAGVDFDIYLTYNGSYILCQGEVIKSAPLSQSDVSCMLSNLKAMNRPVAISTDKIIVANGSDPDLMQYFKFGGQEIFISDDFERTVREEDVYQMMCSAVASEYDSVLKGTDSTQIAAWWDRAVDIIPLSSGKGVAVKAVLERLGLTREEAIAFGDGSNDVPMFEAVGTAVAMENSTEEVKAKATVICPSVEDDGIYQYCKEAGLI